MRKGNGVFLQGQGRALILSWFMQEEKEEKLKCFHMEVMSEGVHSMENFPKDAVIIQFMDASSEAGMATGMLMGSADMAELHVTGQARERCLEMPCHVMSCHACGPSVHEESVIRVRPA